MMKGGNELVSIETRLARGVGAELWRHAFPELRNVQGETALHMQRTPANLHVELCARAARIEAFDGDSLSDWGSGRRGDKLDGFVVLGCTRVNKTDETACYALSLRT
jgi:hypothetical protein